MLALRNMLLLIERAAAKITLSAPTPEREEKKKVKKRKKINEIK